LVSDQYFSFAVCNYADGRLTADKKSPCILGLAANNGYPQCGHVDGHKEQISHLKDTAGSQKIMGS
jgi:hypothetical protein